MLCAIIFISVVIMGAQKNTWCTYTGVKVILGAFPRDRCNFFTYLKIKRSFYR